MTTEYAISKKDSPRWAPVPSKPNVTHIGYDMATKKCTAHAPQLLHLPPQLHLTVAVAVRPDSQIEKWVEELGPKTTSHGLRMQKACGPYHFRHFKSFGQ